jgi:N,N-dimethylformamidase
MARIKLEGYTDRLSVRPGERIDFMVSAEGTTEMQAQLVRLIHGDEHPGGPGFVERPVEAAINRVWPVRKQYTQMGSFLRIDDPDGHLAVTGSFTLHAFIFPTLPGHGQQTIMGRWAVDRAQGYALGIAADGRLEFRLADGNGADQLLAELPLVAQTWYFIAATWDAERREASLRQYPVLGRYNGLLSKIVPYDYASHVVERLRVAPSHAPQTRFLVAAAADCNPARGAFASQLYNGKIDRSGLHGRVLAAAEIDAQRQGGPPPAEALLAYWDTVAHYTQSGIRDPVSHTRPWHQHPHRLNPPLPPLTRPRPPRHPPAPPTPPGRPRTPESRPTRRAVLVSQ